MDLSKISLLKSKNDKKIWILVDKSIQLKEFKPEYQCILLKKGKVFTNSYNFFFYDTYIIANKVIYLNSKISNVLEK